MIQYHRSHPINVFEHTSRYLILLVFPILRAVYSLLKSGVGIIDYLKGSWFDIIIILLIIGLGFIAWYNYVYAVTDTGIYLKQGILFKKLRFISFKRLSILSVEAPFYLIPFKAVRVRADTDGGNPFSPDFKITLSKKYAKTLQELCKKPFVIKDSSTVTYKPKNFHIAILSFITSNSIAGVLFVSTFISGTGKILGKTFQNLMLATISDIVKVLAIGLPPFAAGIAVLLLGGWFVSFSLTIIRHLKFSATRNGNTLTIKSGLFTKTEHLIAVKRINLIEIHQSLLTKWLGFYSVFIHVNGYGKKKDELSILMPAGTKKNIIKNLDELLPEIPFCQAELRPTYKFLSRFLIPPLSWIGGVILGWLTLLYFFPSYSIYINFTGIMAIIPCVWYLFVKITSFFHTGIGETSDTYTFKCTYGFRIKRIAVPKKRVVHIELRRSLFQVMSGSCDLVFHTYSEGRKRHVVPNLPYDKASELVGLSEYSRGNPFTFIIKEKPSIFKKSI